LLGRCGDALHDSKVPIVKYESHKSKSRENKSQHEKTSQNRNEESFIDFKT